jgi:rare lipoprotein A
MKNPVYFIASALLHIALSISSTGQDVYVQYGKASFYGDKFHGRTTANGESYDHEKLTAAHLTLPFGTTVKVTNLSNNRTTIVRINDRGPFVEGRVIDLSQKAAKQLDFIPLGVVDVKVEVLNEKAEPSDQSIVQQQQQDTGNQEFYKLLAQRVHPQGFGVQIGSFKELANLMRVTENLKNRYQNEITVQVLIINSVKVYRIIIGTFPNRNEAERLSNYIC